jgi:metal-dependent HD superfamily phosphatase/phosphodiesterase
MSENATVAVEETVENTEHTDDVSYHAVEKDGSVTAIWEMQNEKHIRTIDPRSSEGKQILALFETAA